MSTVPKTLFFNLEEAANELGVRSMELLWSFARGSIQGQIVNAARYVNSIRFTSDQIVDAAKTGKVVGDLEAHIPFEDSQTPQWFKGTEMWRILNMLQGIREQIKTTSNKVYTEEEAKLFFANENMAPLQRGKVDECTPVSRNVTLEFADFAREKVAVISNGAELSTPFECVLMHYILQYLKNTVYDKISDKGFYSHSPLVWLCSQIHEKKTIGSFLGHPDELAKRIFQISWDDKFQVTRPGDVTISYKVPGVSVFTSSDVKKVAAKLGL